MKKQESVMPCGLSGAEAKRRTRRPRFTPPHFVIISFFILFLAGCGTKTTDTTSAPSAPTGVTATAGNGQVTISWTAVSGATSYNIYWAATTGVTKTNGTKISSATSPYTHASLTNGTTYYYIVTAVNSSGESVESAQASATPAATGSGVGTKFPIATTTAYEFAWGAAFDGSNWLVGIGTDQPPVGGGNSDDAQFISQSGLQVGSLLQGGGNGQSPIVAYDGNNYLLLGGDCKTNPCSLVGRFVSPSGSLVNSFQITSGNHGIAGYGGGDYLVAYTYTTANNNNDPHVVYGRTVSPLGAVGSEFIISTGYGDLRNGKNIAFDGTNFLVVWNDDSNDYEIRGRFVSPAGVPGTEFSINASTYPSDNIMAMAVAFDGTNYLVVWTDEVSSGEWDVFGQIVTPSGTLSGSVISISTAAGQQFFPQIAFDGTNYLVTWTDMRNDTDKDGVCASNEGTCLDIYGQYISKAATLEGSEFVINNDAGNQGGGVAGFANGKYLVIVNDGLTNGHSNDAYGVFVTP